MRQVALVARDCEAIAGQLQETFAWDEPYHDPGVSEFGLRNAVFAAGDTFVDSGGGHVHLIRNETGSVAKTIAVQLVPHGSMRRLDAPDPGNCSF